ncbi:MAG: Gfo/Idh/MocA family oxidoreductase [Chloroflexi bacterium]|nr:Gfo/Idh/MocA family oxidoreductase [Chloroflexota bacterium]
MKFLVVGCGSIGRRHLRNIMSLGEEELTALDVLPERRQAVKDELGLAVFSGLPEALASRPDVAFVTTPTSLHIPVALAAAEQGCHLFIEKPLSHSLEGLERLLSLVQTKGLVTLVGCNLRFHPGLVRVKKLLNEGAIGKVVAARVQVGQWLPDWHPGEDYRKGYSAQRWMGGGAVLDAIHELDYIQWLVGSPVRQVACFAGKLSRLEIEAEDTAAVLLRFADDTIGEVHMDYVQRAYSRSCHIIGDKGTIRWDYAKGQVCCYAAAEGRWEVSVDPPGWEPNQMYLDEVRHFLRCLAGDEEPAQDVLAGARTLKVALAAKAAAETGQVIRLDG